MNNLHWHITADGQKEQIITAREMVRAKAAEAASYLTSNALTVAGSYTLRIWTCRDAACLPFDAEGEERRKAEELARLSKDESFLDGGA
jgi:hypothetical protein